MSFRRGVAAILSDQRGRILICERIGTPGAWQFPQGGIDVGETAEIALARELREEIGVPRAAYEIIDSKGPHRYRFGAGHRRKGFEGQSHRYFLLRLTAPKTVVHVGVPNPEFSRARWIKPEEFRLAWLPPMKRGVYRRVFWKFFGVKLSEQA